MIEHFGQLPDGRPVSRVTISSGALTASLLSHGARLQDLRLDGGTHPLVLGSDRLEDYLGPMDSFGATIGRYANRIAGGRVTLDGREHRLDRNEDDRTCLHGGRAGTHALNWQVEDHGPAHVTFALLLPDGHMGFPGQLATTVTYRCAGAALDITIEAAPDAPCPLSFAHHSYFILDTSGDVAGHELHVAAAQYLPVDAAKIPTGDLAPVDGTRFDFRTPRPVGTGGYDHNFCLDAPAGAAGEDGAMIRAARLRGRSGLALSVETDAPGLQVYDAAHLPASGLPGLDGQVYRPRAGLALETQEWPDAPNQPDFPDPVIRPGNVYRNRTRYGFTR